MEQKKQVKLSELPTEVKENMKRSMSEKLGVNVELDEKCGCLKVKGEPKMKGGKGERVKASELPSQVKKGIMNHLAKVHEGKVVEMDSTGEKFVINN